MFVARHNFGLVDSIKPEAIGSPGKRIFRILVDGSLTSAATLWVEKEQVYGLSMAMKRMLEAPPAGEAEPEAEEEKEVHFPQLADPSVLQGGEPRVLEFKVGRLGLAFGPGEEHITVFLHDERDEPEVEEDDDEAEEETAETELPAPTLQFCLKRAQAEDFIRASLDVTSSGRGTDAISRHAMVASGKVDPNRNGHFRH
jgi:uncharacterized repeat protein (TIGR03847 family)